MINITKSELSLRNKTHPIIKWEVWFRTPLGLFANLSDAILKLEESDMNPDLMIVPVPVAIAAETYEVWQL